MVQSLLNRIYAGHQEWTKSGEEPKAPLDPPKQPTSMMGVTGSYVTSAVSWVAGSIMGKSDGAPAGTPAGASAGAAANGEPPKAISSSTVSAVLPPQPTVDLSVEELESLGQATKSASLERTESQRDDDMWNETPTKSAATQAWGDDWAENEKEEPKKDGVEAMGGWGDTDLAFSDDNEEEKEDAYLEKIRQMGKKAPAASQSSAKTSAESQSSAKTSAESQSSAKTPVTSQSSAKTLTSQSSMRPMKMTPMNLDDWAQTFVEEAPAKSAARSKRATKDLDLTSLLGDSTEKTKSGLGDDWDEKPAKPKTTKSSGWDDDWDEKPVKTKTTSSGWDDDDLFSSKPAKTTAKATNSGWDDDWDEKPAKSKPAKSSGWDDDWDEKPAKPKATKSSGWDDDWDEKPVKAKTTSSGWDDDDLFSSKPAKATAKNSGWDDDW